MRFREFNFAIAIAVSIAAHLLLWPVVQASDIASDRAWRERVPRRGMPQVTLVLNGDGVDLA